MQEFFNAFRMSKFIGRVNLTGHATRRIYRGASRLVLTLPGWRVKARGGPRRDRRDARARGHTTAAEHGTITPLSHLLAP